MKSKLAVRAVPAPRTAGMTCLRGLLLFVMLLSLATEVPSAEWVAIGESAAGKVFYDRGTLKNSRGVIELSEKIVYTAEGRQKYIDIRTKHGLDVQGYENLSYSLNRWEVSCATNGIRVTATAYYSADGIVLDSSSYQLAPSEGWHAVAPGSAGEGLFLAVCEPQKGKRKRGER